MQKRGVRLSSASFRTNVRNLASLRYTPPTLPSPLKYKGGGKRRGTLPPQTREEVKRRKSDAQKETPCLWRGD